MCRRRGVVARHSETTSRMRLDFDAGKLSHARICHGRVVTTVMHGTCDYPARLVRCTVPHHYYYLKKKIPRLFLEILGCTYSCPRVSLGCSSVAGNKAKCMQSIKGYSSGSVLLYCKPARSSDLLGRSRRLSLCSTIPPPCSFRNGTFHLDHE